jgi:hypothetical protein
MTPELTIDLSRLVRDLGGKPLPDISSAETGNVTNDFNEQVFQHSATLLVATY